VLRLPSLCPLSPVEMEMEENKASRPQKDVVLDARLEGDGQAVLAGNEKLIGANDRRVFGAPNLSAFLNLSFIFVPLLS
jgi:hypothetical protein